MKVALDRIVMTIAGEPFQPEASLRAAVCNALTANLPGDEKLGIDEKLKIHRLAAVCYQQPSDAAGCVELSVEELALIRKRAAMAYSIHFFGQMAAMLEQPVVDVAVKVSSLIGDDLGALASVI